MKRRADKNLTYKERFKKRVVAMHSNAQSDLWEAAYGKVVRVATKRKPVNLWPAPDERVRLPWTLNYLLLKADTALTDFDNDCPYCKCALRVDNLSLDHKIPVSRRMEFMDELCERSGLKDLMLAAFAWENIVLCCVDCNKRKGVLTRDEFVSVMEFVRKLSDVGRRYVLKQLAMSEHRYTPTKKNEVKPTEADQGEQPCLM